MHKAAFLSSYENVKALLELGASPNYRDPIGLTPLYYNMLTTDSNDQVGLLTVFKLALFTKSFLKVAEMLLREAADIGVTDMHGNHEIHQVSSFVCLGAAPRAVSFPCFYAPHSRTIIAFKIRMFKRHSSISGRQPRMRRLAALKPHYYVPL
ncbi:unnamed protein product [Strongylus vulgaris]|uniref:Uncharacterized protein n=1 Tax=Strongylus vulgaris TaxID=40348 RepID=A0A3P7KHU0_STRVU|nr:unnamed protein product [Strongylus vulgaris]